MDLSALPRVHARRRTIAAKTRFVFFEFPPLGLETGRRLGVRGISTTTSVMLCRASYRVARGNGGCAGAYEREFCLRFFSGRQ